MSTATGYAFARFRVEVGRRQLLRDDGAVPLTTKAFDTLLMLVRHLLREK
jgi:hypothetical protein